jgi:hypothetical protein
MFRPLKKYHLTPLLPVRHAAFGFTGGLFCVRV